jgi:hypothetical protein
MKYKNDLNTCLHEIKICILKDVFLYLDKIFIRNIFMYSAALIITSMLFMPTLGNCTDPFDLGQSLQNPLEILKEESHLNPIISQVDLDDQDTYIMPLQYDIPLK